LKPKNGFTLVELLISGLIFSLIALSLYSAFRTANLTYKRIDRASYVDEAARLLLNRIENELKNSFAFQEDDSRFEGNGQSLDFFSVTSYYDEKAKSHPLICRIKYEFSGEKLIYSQYCGLDSIQPQDQVSPETEELSAIKEVKFEFAESGPDKLWQTVWPNEKIIDQKKALPGAIRITLTVQEKKIKEEQEAAAFNFTKIVPLLRKYD